MSIIPISHDFYQVSKKTMCAKGEDTTLTNVYVALSIQHGLHDLKVLQRGGLL